MEGRDGDNHGATMDLRRLSGVGLIAGLSDRTLLRIAVAYLAATGKPISSQKVSKTWPPASRQVAETLD